MGCGAGVVGAALRGALVRECGGGVVGAALCYMAVRYPWCNQTHAHRAYVRALPLQKVPIQRACLGTHGSFVSPRCAWGWLR